VREILTPPDSNPKVAKNEKVLGVRTNVLHLAPAVTSGREMCPKRSPGCTAACLFYAGNPLYMAAKNKSRLAKTALFWSDRTLFMNILALEIAKQRNKAKDDDVEYAVRLNGTSDIVWEKERFNLLPGVQGPLKLPLGTDRATIMELFPDVQFYDYTKIPKRTPPKNYYLIFSESEINAKEVEAEMQRGRNIAVVFTGGLPATYRGRPVIDGDVHDYRPSDPDGDIVGLKVKGLGRGETTGFVHMKEAA
jgi:hypothetical protein